MNNRRELILEKLQRILRDEWPAETEALVLDTNTSLFYEGIGLDSVDGATLLLAIEEAFEIDIDKNALGQSHFKTIGSLTNFIEESLPTEHYGQADGD